MAVIRQGEVRKLTKELAMQKLDEFNNIMLQLEGEGKREKRKAVKTAIARLKTHLFQLEKIHKGKTTAASA